MVFMAANFLLPHAKNAIKHVAGQKIIRAAIDEQFTKIKQQDAITEAQCEIKVVHDGDDQ